MCVCPKWIPNGLRVSLMRCAASGSGKVCSLFVVVGPLGCCALVAVICVPVKAEALVAMVNLQSTLAVLCKAAKSAAGYQSHPQSPWNLLEVLQPQPAADVSRMSPLCESRRRGVQAFAAASGLTEV
jgi:hypothetical protein